MAAWFHKKPRLTPHGQYPVEITRAIHTMADDMGGGQSDRREPAEPLVAFEPNQTPERAAFYAAPEMQEPIATTEPEPMGRETGRSPFLNEAAESLPVAPTINETPSLMAQERVSPSVAREEAAIPPPLVPRVPEPLKAPEAITLTSPSRLSGKRKKWFWIGLGIGILFLLVGALGYWWMKRSEGGAPVMTEGEVKEILPPETSVTIETAPSTSHYQADQANLLSFDIETVTAETITTEFLKIALSVKQDGLKGPVTFLVRDQNYNPLAFARFAYLLGLELDPALLTTLDEDFALYFSRDGEYVRTGFQVTIRDQVAFAVALKKSEASLPKVLAPLYLDTTTAPKTSLTFRSGLYREQPVRYVNIDRPMNLSIDYAVRENQWLVGTSQHTLRALLDRPIP